MNKSTGGNETFTDTVPTMYYVQITLWCILLVWSLLGNVLVIAVVYCNQNLRTNMNYLIVNMAVSDLLIPLVTAPRAIFFYIKGFAWLVDGPFGEALCKLVHVLIYASPFVSSISLVVIALQRFVAVVYPTRGQILSRKTRWIAILFPWIVAMALFSPYSYTQSLTHMTKDYAICLYILVPFNSSETVLIAISIQTAVGFVIPLISIIILYAIIIYKLRKSLNNVMDLIEKAAIRSRQRRNRRIFSMLITIVVLFTICWCPFMVFSLFIWASRNFQNIHTISALYLTFRYMWYLLAAINPCIYFVFLKDFRQGLKRLCCRKTPSAIEPIFIRPRGTGGDSNQDPTCTLPHINTTSV